jgi:hypothetical protein
VSGDHVRKVVVSHPYAADSTPASISEVLDLSPDGALSFTGVTFALGRSVGGQMAFTPDGLVGMVADENGALGVMRFDESGAATVVHEAFTGSFYAGAVVVEPSGDTALVLDPNWRENGGGLYRVRIACDGTLVDEGLVAAAKLPKALAWLDARGMAVLAAADVLGSAPGDDAHLIGVSPMPEVVAGVDAFGDDDAIVSAAAATHDGKYVLIGDNNAFSVTPNRVAVVAVANGALEATQLLSPIDDPVALATSPFGDAALVLSGFANAIVELGYDPANIAEPFEVRGELSYAGAPPELPSSVVTIQSGGLLGLSLVTEVASIRQVRFERSGTVTDLGTFSFGEGTDRIIGSIGVQP